MGSGVTFVAPREDIFRKTLRDRVDAYFATTGLSKNANWQMVLKTVLLFVSYVGGLALLWTAQELPVILGTSVVLGLTIAGIGFNVAHDACHGSYSESRTMNRLMSHSFTICGVHAYNWRFIHNVLHHTFTNIPERDGDLHVPVVRYCDIPGDGGARWYHRFQHVYAFALYSLASVVWVFWKDYRHMVRTVHMGYPKRKPPLSEYGLLAFSKLLHYSLFLFIPYFVSGRSIGVVIASFFAMHLVAGLILATVFAAAHLCEEVEQPRTDANGVIHTSWFAHQLRTTANFATHSKLLFWTVGGLNFQVEHHLFPYICHVHYPAIAPIVRDTAREFGVPYTEFPTFMAAQKAHVRFLKRYGTPLPQPTEAAAVS